ncbi:MAG: helix-turn-helix transcriptional regulator [Acutalibacter sp.]|nr:helix-turn-helix transcriptional regulator [Acutalibacter sp.]
MSIAERLVKARGERTRESVAREIGVSLSAISMYETGARVPRDEIKVKLADCYHKTVQDLFFAE